MRRVAVIGCSGSGKSVLAQELGRITGLPVIHLDQAYWQPGWVTTPRDKWREMQREFVSGREWIIDGNYGGTMEMRLRAADTVVFLDYSRLACLRGVIQRYLMYRRGRRPDMADGNDERLSFEFLKWIWRYPTNDRPTVMQRLWSLPPTTRIVRLRNREEARLFLHDATVQQNAG